MMAKEVAARLGVTTKTVIRWERKGKIPKGFQGDRIMLWDRETMERFLAEHLPGTEGTDGT